jgi:hypothetical protein
MMLASLPLAAASTQCVLAADWPQARVIEALSP